MVTIFGAQIKAAYCKNISKFVRIDQFVRDLQPKQIFRLTDRQTLNCCMATKLLIEPKWKGNLSNKEKFKRLEQSFKSYSEIKEYFIQKLGKKSLKIFKN